MSRCRCRSTAYRMGNASLQGIPQCTCASRNLPELTANNSWRCSFHGFSNSLTSHWVMTYAHAVDEASVNRHALLVGSRNAVTMHCSRESLRVCHARSCSSPHSGAVSGTALAAAMLRFFLPLIILLT